MGTKQNVLDHIADKVLEVLYIVREKDSNAALRLQRTILELRKLALKKEK